MKLFLCLAVFVAGAQAGEYVVLSNGFRIHADGHSVNDGVMTIQLSQGAIEIPANTVASIEAGRLHGAPATTGNANGGSQARAHAAGNDHARSHAQWLPPEIVRSVAKPNRATR